MPTAHQSLSAVLLTSALVATSAVAQVATWNFNTTLTSAPFPATTGAGSAALIGGVTFTQNTGSPNDTGVPNNAPNTTGYPAQGTGAGTAGVEFTFSTAGFDNIRFLFDQRHSNTSSRYVMITYSVDGGSTYVDGPVFTALGGDTWHPDREINLTGVAGAANNPSLRVRVVSTFDPNLVNQYSASRTTSTYAGTGTLRIDNVRVLGDATVSVPPQSSGSFSPSAVCRGGAGGSGQTTLTVTASPGQNPASGQIVVTADLSALGGSATQVLDLLGGNTYSTTINVPAEAATGFVSIPVTASDELLRSSTSSVTLAVGDCSTDSGAPVVISMIYGAGGNAGAIFNADFVEIYNRSCAPVNLDGWSLQYTSAGANNSFDGLRQVNLSGTIGSGQYRLIQTQRISETAAGLPIPAPDFLAFPAIPSDPPVPPQTQDGFGMAADAGRVALASTTAPLGFGCVHATVVDLVGYGGTASCYAGVAPTGTISATLAAIRRNDGCTDSNQDFSDFEAIFPRDPRNAASAPFACSDCPPPSCPADFNQDGDLNPDDLGDYINCYFSVPPCGQADINADGDVNPDDLGDFINAYFAGCP